MVSALASGARGVWFDPYDQFSGSEHALLALLARVKLIHCTIHRIEVSTGREEISSMQVKDRTTESKSPLS